MSHAPEYQMVFTDFWKTDGRVETQQPFSSLTSAVDKYLSVCVFIVLICSGVVILLYEAKVLFTLPFEHQFSALLVGWQVAL